MQISSSSFQVTTGLHTHSMETYFAEIDKEGNVLRVIVSDETFIKSGAVGEPTKWIQTDMDGVIRRNPAVRGGKYYKEWDCFALPKPHKSWILNEKTMQWEASKPQPVSEVPHVWDEELQNWREYTELTSLRNGLSQQ